MTHEIDTSKGWTEAIIYFNCEFSQFEKVISILNTNLNIVFTNKVNDFDSYYLDFIYNDSNLCLHYNTYLGISIFPTSFKEASLLDNENVIKIANALMIPLEDFNWVPFKNSKTIGTTGSEGGKIIEDLENIDGARITLEKDCGNIPFAVTLGIYGLMFHTHFDSSLENANLFIDKAKDKISKILELYDVPENSRSEIWHDKKNKLLEELVEIAKI